MDDEDYYVEDHEDVEEAIYVEEEEEMPVVDEESEEEVEDNEEEKKEKKIKQKKVDLKEKYNILASKKYPTTQEELKQGVSFFDLSLWQDCKVAEQTTLDFETRKKETVKGLYTCGKCKGIEVYTISVQRRSGDEASDNYASCINCKNLWKV